MSMKHFFEALARSAITGLGSNYKNVPDLDLIKSLLQHMGRNLNHKKVNELMILRRRSSLYVDALMIANRSYTSKLLEMWKKDDCRDYLSTKAKDNYLVNFSEVTIKSPRRLQSSIIVTSPITSITPRSSYLEQNTGLKKNEKGRNILSRLIAADSKPSKEFIANNEIDVDNNLLNEKEDTSTGHDMFDSSKDLASSISLLYKNSSVPSTLESPTSPEVTNYEFNKNSLNLGLRMSSSQVSPFNKRGAFGSRSPSSAGRNDGVTKLNSSPKHTTLPARNHSIFNYSGVGSPDEIKSMCSEEERDRGVNGLSRHVKKDSRSNLSPSTTSMMVRNNSFKHSASTSFPITPSDTNRNLVNRLPTSSTTTKEKNSDLNVKDVEIEVKESRSTSTTTLPGKKKSLFLL